MTEEEIRKDERDKIADWHDRTSKAFFESAKRQEKMSRWGSSRDYERTLWAAHSHAAHAAYIRTNKYK